jgi:two-component system, NtrC family, sensor kinase
MRRSPKSAKSKVESKPHLARKSAKSDDARVRDLEKRLEEALQRETEGLKREAEALDRQTATAEILRVISESQTEVQPVFEAIADSAMRLFRAWSALIFRYDGELLSLAAARGGLPGSSESFLARFQAPRRPDDDTIHGRTVVTRAVQHIADVEADAYRNHHVRRSASERGFRSVVWVPMLRGNEAVGAIGVSRVQSGGFSDAEIALLQTFADQAVIAIENVRLFTELQEKNRALTQAHSQVTEALDQQTATSEILRVISSSPTDVQPVFEAIVRGASGLLGGLDCIAVRFDGTLMHLLARHNPRPGTTDVLTQLYPQPPTRTLSMGRVILDKTIVHISDVREDAAFDQRYAELIRLRGVLAVPIKRDDSIIGGISVSRSTPGHFSERQIALLQTFADQGVIAIENVRLFTELQASNQDLSAALDTQTATSDILRVISRSQIDVQPVFQAIVDSAQRLLHGNSSVVSRIVDDRIELAAYTHTGVTADALLESFFPIPLHPAEPDTRPIREGVIGARVPYNVADTETDPRVGDRGRTNARARGYRSQLVVPMLRHDEVIGTIAVTRPETGEFTDDEIALLQTFAGQAVIAIENVRLFKELEASNQEIAEKSRQIELASQHKSEFLANMSHELRTPLNAIIGFSEVLSERMFGELNEKQEEYLKDIHASGQHLLSLINDILDLSKIEAGRMELKLTDFNLPQAIDNALILVRERAGRRGITLEHAVDERLGEIRGDERKVKQVLLNLLSNALKFTPEGGRVDVRAGMVDGMAEISVTDTGVGIAPEDQEKVFEEFRQVGTVEKKAEGTGLGLTLCRKFVELHGGRIWVKSEVGVGSTFTFRLPVRCGE